MKKTNKYDVGCVVGRFQVDDLHKGHLSLLTKVSNSHEKLIIIIGISPCKCTYRNPLDLNTRKIMLQEHFPSSIISYVNDTQDDYLWSENLDNVISSLIGTAQTVCIYGSRDSFLPYYHGKYETKEFIQEIYISGTEIRKQIAARSKQTKDFRAGAIWAMGNQWPAPKFCIDVAIFNNAFTKILLGRKVKEDKYRFIGGFVDNGETLAETVAREALEETHLIVNRIQFIDSFFIDDWRYKGERDKITTVLHTATIESGRPQPDDDIHELKWFDFEYGLENEVIENHKDMMKTLLRFYDDE